MDIFKPADISGIKLKNRIIRSATHEGFSDSEGRPLKGLTDLYMRLAKGGAGAIITGCTSIQRNGMGTVNMHLIDNEECIDMYKRISSKLKESGIPLIMQLVHCGSNSHSSISGRNVVAPSKYKNRLYGSTSAELDEKGIEEIIGNFVKAIIRAKKSGFSGVQLHVAHGYILNEFLSLYINKRRDRWGGSLENRFRITGEIIRRAREEVGKYPILAKISAYDGNKNGIRIDDGVRIAVMLQEAGIDAVEVSCGGVDDGMIVLRAEKPPVEAIMKLVPMYRDLPPLKKKIVTMMLPYVMKMHTPLLNYNVSAAEVIKKNVDVPVIAVGGIRKLADIKDILDNGKADFVSMSRPFIIEPDIVNKFKEGKQSESRCINCGYCIFGVTADNLKCYHGKVREVK